MDCLWSLELVNLDRLFVLQRKVSIHLGGIVLLVVDGLCAFKQVFDANVGVRLLLLPLLVFVCIDGLDLKLDLLFRRSAV